MKYLTPELKAYYMKDFNENILTCNDPYWKLEPQIKSILININKNPELQTILSKKCTSVNTPVSYLLLATSKKFEPTLKRILDLIQNKVPMLDQHIDPPVKWLCEGINELPENVQKMGCISNENYYNISKYTIWLETKKLGYHKLLWEYIEQYLDISKRFCSFVKNIKSEELF